MKTVVHVGPFPPPYGGVSIHLSRLKAESDRMKLPIIILDTTSPAKNIPGVIHTPTLRSQVAFLRSLPASIIHFHNFLAEAKLLISYALVPRRHCMVLSFHNDRFWYELERAGYWTVAVAKRVLSRMRVVVVDTAKSRSLAERLISGDRIETIPEFIPPTAIPELDRNELLEIRANHEYLLVSNAFQLTLVEGRDLYGVDLLIDAVDRLWNGDGSDVACAFLLPAVGDETYWTSVQRRVRELGLEERFHFIRTPLLEPSSLWKIADVFVRATLADGNSVSLLEALAVGTPVIASDCTERPAGTVEYRTGDVDALVGSLRSVLADLAGARRRVADLEISNNAARFFALYERLSKEMTS